MRRRVERREVARGAGGRNVSLTRNLDRWPPLLSQFLNICLLLCDRAASPGAGYLLERLPSRGPAPTAAIDLAEWQAGRALEALRQQSHMTGMSVEVVRLSLCRLQTWSRRLILRRRRSRGG